MNTIIALAQLIVLLTYVGFLLERFGVLPSISDSVYHLEGKKKFLFTLTLVVVGILNLHHDLGNYGVIATLGLFWTGATVTFRRGGTATPLLHYSGATIAIVMSMTGLLVLHGIWFLPISVLAVSYILGREGNFIWWLEIVAFVHILGAYMVI